jgi:anti-sigma B factor antagonist
VPEAAQQKPSVEIIQLAGHVRMGELVDRLRGDVDNNLSSGNIRLVVNMDHVRSLDSSGIGVLVRSLSLAKQKGGNMKLSQVPAAVKQTLQVTGIVRLFEFFDSDEEAIASYGS